MRITRAIASNRKVATALSAIGLAAALAGCGSSGSSSTSTTTSVATTAATTPASSSTSSQTTTSATSAGGGTTAPGTQLSVGTPATVNYHPGIEAKNPTYHLQVSVMSIQKGSQSDLNGIELEKAQQGQTPYYVKLQVRNLGAGNASAEDGVPAAGFQAMDDRGQQGEELTILGTFRPCESGTQPKQFTKGVTFNTCIIYMVGGGGSIVSEQWNGSGDAYSEKPIVWKAG